MMVSSRKHQIHIKRSKDVALSPPIISARKITLQGYVHHVSHKVWSPIKTSETFGIPHSDPGDTPDDEFQFDICGSHEGEVPANDYGVKSGIIPSGRCAIAIHKGSHDTIGDTVYYLYQKWLPDSGKDLRDFPCFFRYLNFVHEVDEYELLTEIYLPIK